MKLKLLTVAMMMATQIASAGHIDFFENKSQGGSREGTLPDDHKVEINLKKHNGWKNDEIKSFKLRWVTPGTRILLFDDPKGSEKDDWVEITVNSWQKELDMKHLEINIPWNNSKMSMKYHKKNGLNGKVSHIKIYPARPHEPPMAARLNLCVQTMDGYEFKKKRGLAEEIKSQGSNYRARFPDIMLKADGSFRASFKVEHIRNNAKDDYAMVKMDFDKDRNLVDSSTDVVIDKRSLSADADKIWANVPKAAQGDKYVTIAKVATATAAELYDVGTSHFEHGGRKNFPYVIETVMNDYGKAIADCEQMVNPPPEIVAQSEERKAKSRRREDREGRDMRNGAGRRDGRQSGRYQYLASFADDFGKDTAFTINRIERVCESGSNDCTWRSNDSSPSVKGCKKMRRAVGEDVVAYGYKGKMLSGVQIRKCNR